MSYALSHIFRQPAKLVSINETAGRSWQSTSAFKRFWREAGWAHGNEIKHELHRIGFATPLRVPATVDFCFNAYTNTRRDGHNYSGTVCKWFIDGMVQAKVFYDDSVEHLTLLDPTFVVVPRSEPLTAIVTLEMGTRP